MHFKVEYLHLSCWQPTLAALQGYLIVLQDERMLGTTDILDVAVTVASIISSWHTSRDPSALTSLSILAKLLSLANEPR